MVCIFLKSKRNLLVLSSLSFLSHGWTVDVALTQLWQNTFRRKLGTWIILWVRFSTITTLPLLSDYCEREIHLFVELLYSGFFLVQQFSQCSHRNTVTSLVTVRKTMILKKRDRDWGHPPTLFLLLLPSVILTNTPFVTSNVPGLHNSYTHYYCVTVIIAIIIMEFMCDFDC